MKTMAGSKIENNNTTERLKKSAVGYTVENPKLSIIVPTYNNEAYLEKCLFSLVEQTLKDIEIIVVNDGSEDLTENILNMFKNADKRIKIINQENKGQGASRNNGMRNAKGEYIGFVDSDDWVDSDYYEKLYNTAKKYNSDIALANYIRIGNGKTKNRLNIEKEELVTDLQDKIDLAKQAKNPCPTNKIYKRSLIENNKIIWEEGVFCEDRLFTIQTIYYAKSMVAVPNVNYYYFRNPKSTVNTNSHKMILAKHNANRKVINFLKEKKAQIRDKDFWAVTKEIRVFNIPLFQKKISLNTEKLYFCGLPIAEFCNCTDYKRKQFRFCGIKFTYKNRNWKARADEQNLILNKTNLSYKVPSNENNILFIASHFIKTGGIETRLIQYAQELTASGENVFILSEDNANEKLSQYTNFKLNFDADNFDKCLNDIADTFGIKTIEFQFKNPKILKKLNLEKLKTKVRLGCVIHNIGVKNLSEINKFDYKIIVSRYLYENYYKGLKNAVVIPNGINTDEYKELKCWKYTGQKKAVLISRINKDKIKSIECFIKYCKKKNIEFEIAGDEQRGSDLINKLIGKYKLSKKQFIGSVNTLEYLNGHADEILFIGGVGLVMLEGGYLNYPCFVCSSWKDSSYSFVTNSNIGLFDNFTIRKNSPISLERKKVCEFNPENLDMYSIRDYIIENRTLKHCFAIYNKLTEGIKDE